MRQDLSSSENQRNKNQPKNHRLPREEDVDVRNSPCWHHHYGFILYYFICGEKVPAAILKPKNNNLHPFHSLTFLRPADTPSSSS
jgi:hypothetical protein